MSIVPRDLNIPLEPRERGGFARGGLVLLAACAVAIAASAFASVAFAKAFTASCIVLLPVMWLLFFPPRAVAPRLQRAGFTRVLVYAVVCGYFMIAKQVLIPAVLTGIEQVLA